MLGVVLAFVSVGFGHHWVSGSLKEAMRVPLHVLEVLLCSAHRAYMTFAFSRLPTFSHQLLFFIVLFIIYPVGSPLFIQFCATGAGAGAGAGLQVVQALRCSSNTLSPLN